MQLARVAPSSSSLSKKLARLNNRRDYPVHIFPLRRGTERELTTPGVRSHLAWCGIPVPLFNFAWGQATRLIFGPILLDASQFSGPQLSGHFHPSSTQQQHDVHPSLPRIGRSASAEQILWPAIRSASSARARLREAAAPCPEVHCPFHVLLRGRPSSGASSGHRRSADANRPLSSRAF